MYSTMQSIIPVTCHYTYHRNHPSHTTWTCYEGHHAFQGAAV